MFGPFVKFTYINVSISPYLYPGEEPLLQWSGEDQDGAGVFDCSMLLLSCCDKPATLKVSCGYAHVDGL